MQIYTKHFFEPDKTNIFKSLQNLNSDLIVKIIDHKILVNQGDPHTLHQEVITEKVDCFERNYSVNPIPEHENDLHVYLLERSPRERYNMMMKVYEKYLELAPKLYDLGIYHTDLRFHNFMVDKNDDPKIIDVEHFNNVTPYEFMFWHNGFLSFFQQTFSDQMMDHLFYRVAINLE